MLVKLQYFKYFGRCPGKFYSEAEYETEKEHHHEIIEEVRHMQWYNKLPGLTKGRHFHMVVTPQGEGVDVPRLILGITSNES